MVQPLVLQGGYARPVQAILIDKITFDLNVYGLGTTVKCLLENGIKLAVYKITSDHLTEIGIFVRANYYHKNLSLELQNSRE